MADEKSTLLPQEPYSTSTPSAPRPPRGATPPLPRVLAFIVRILEHWSIHWLHNVQLGFLTINSLVAAYWARSDPGTMAYVVTTYAALMLFFCSVRAFERAPPARKRPLKVSICALGASVIGLFSYRTASVMPVGYAVAIWVVAGFSIVAGFYAIFFGDGEKGPAVAAGRERQS